MPALLSVISSCGFVFSSFSREGSFDSDCGNGSFAPHCFDSMQRTAKSCAEGEKFKTSIHRGSAEKYSPGRMAGPPGGGTQGVVQRGTRQ